MALPGPDFTVESDCMPFTAGQKEQPSSVLTAFAALDCLQGGSFAFLSTPYKHVLHSD